MEGFLPTPCHKLQVEVEEPYEKKHILVEVYSITDPNIDCIQALKDFNESVPLGVLKIGSYTVWLNRECLGKFYLP